MRGHLRSVFLLAGVVVLGGCAGTGSAGTTQNLIDESIAAIGGEEKLKTIQMVVLRGSGKETFLGEGMNAKDPGPGSTLDIVEVYDYANGRAALEFDMVASPWNKTGVFASHRREVVGEYGEGEAAKPAAYVMRNYGGFGVMSPGGFHGFSPHPSPDVAMRRSYLGMLTDISGAAAEDRGVEDREFDGKTHKMATGKTRQGEPLNLYFDPDTKLLVGYDITETHDVMGDIRSTYTFSDFKPVDGVQFPHRVTLRGDVGNSADIEYTSVTFGNNPLAEYILTLPARDPAPGEVKKVMSGDSVPLRMVTVAPGVIHAEGYSHSSMIVEFPRWLVVVEAPQTDLHTRVVAEQVSKLFPGKPVQYVVVTHPHHDHIGGVRGWAARGATVVVEKGHEEEMKRILDAPHSYPPDELERNRRNNQKVGGLEVYEGKKVISDGNRTLEMYAIPTTHVDTMVIPYLSSDRILFTSDLGGPVLVEAVTKHNLRPQQVVSGHTGITPYANR